VCGGGGCAERVPLGRARAVAYGSLSARAGGRVRAWAWVGGTDTGAGGWAVGLWGN